MTTVFLIDGATLDDVGLIPHFLDENDPRPAREQFDEHYQHGGGWQPFEGFKFKIKTNEIKYPGDPAMKPLVACVYARRRL